MAEEAETDVSAAGLKTLLGAADWDIETLCNNAAINKFSWYTSRPKNLDANLLCELTSPAPTTDRKLGDFRRYNHTALTPSIYYNPAMTKQYIGSGTFQFIIPCRPERMNLAELSANDPMYWKTIYYLSSANRASEVSAHGSYTDTSFNILATESGIPAGHTNNQSKSPSTSLQLFTDPAFDPTGLSTPSDIVYCDTFIVNSGGTRIIRVGTAVSDSYLDITFTQVTAPYHSKTGPYVVGAPAGYTVVIPVVTTNASSYLGIDQAYTNGDTTYSTYWYLAGLSGSTWYRLGNVGAVATISGVGATTTEIFNGTLANVGASSNEFDSGTLSGSEAWNTGEIGELSVVVASWSGFDSYALPAYPG